MYDDMVELIIFEICKQFMQNLINILTTFIFHLQSTEHIGEVFQDEQNMAAILMHQHKETGDLLMVSYDKSHRLIYISK